MKKTEICCNLFYTKVVFYNQRTPMSSDRGQLEQQYSFDKQQIHKKDNLILNISLNSAEMWRFSLFQSVMQEYAS